MIHFSSFLTLRTAIPHSSSPSLPCRCSTSSSGPSTASCTSRARARWATPSISWGRSTRLSPRPRPTHTRNSIGGSIGCTGWHICLETNSHGLSAESSGSCRATTLATYCPGRLTEHSKLKSTGGFHRHDVSPCWRSRSSSWWTMTDTMSCRFGTTTCKIELLSCLTCHFWLWRGEKQKCVFSPLWSKLEKSGSTLRTSESLHMYSPQFEAN